MNVDVLSKDGQKVGQVDLPDSIFGIEPHEHAMYMSVRTYLAHQRQGTHKTKTRTEVSGGGRKPWKQKGRGTARAGSTRSGVWVGGGTMFGPKPHTYDLKINKKLNRLARKSALSARLKENNLIILDDFALDLPKTKSMVSVFKALEIADQKTLLILPGTNYDSVIMSSRNLPTVRTAPANTISAYDVLNHKKVVIIKSALESVIRSFGE